MNESEKIGEQLSEREIIDVELAALPQVDIEAAFQELLAVWDEKTAFEERPDMAFGLRDPNITDDELRRRIYLIREWYKLYPGRPSSGVDSRIESPRGEEIKRRLLEFAKHGVF